MIDKKAYMIGENTFSKWLYDNPNEEITAFHLGVEAYEAARADQTFGCVVCGGCGWVTGSKDGITPEQEECESCYGTGKITKRRYHMSINECRTAFEEWAAKKGYDILLTTRLENHGIYRNQFTQDAWVTWQAAINFQTPAMPRTENGTEAQEAGAAHTEQPIRLPKAFELFQRVKCQWMFDNQKLALDRNYTDLAEKFAFDMIWNMRSPMREAAKTDQPPLSWQTNSDVPESFRARLTEAVDASVFAQQPDEACCCGAKNLAYCTFANVHPLCRLGKQSDVMQPEATERVAQAIKDSMTITKYESGKEPEITFSPPLSDCLHIANAAISAMKRESSALWQPLETAPEAQHVLVWLPNYGVNRAQYTMHFTQQYWWNGEQRVYPTHWMPEPPKPEGL